MGRRLSPVWLATGVAACPLACDGETEVEEPTTVLVPQRWVFAPEAAVSPWDEPPPGRECPTAGYGDEGLFFEVRTGVCEWGTWTQDVREPLQAGDLVSFDFHHLDLFSSEPSVAVVALGAGDVEMWSEVIPIPRPRWFERVEVAVPQGADGAGRVWLHVHNHGSNSYRFGPADVRRRR